MSYIIVGQKAGVVNAFGGHSVVRAASGTSIGAELNTTGSLRAAVRITESFGGFSLSPDGMRIAFGAAT